jgi:hypothetical protein
MKKPWQVGYWEPWQVGYNFRIIRCFAGESNAYAFCNYMNGGQGSMLPFNYLEG